MNADTLLATLTGLGDTPDQVADRLRTAGIRGRRHNPERCPVTVALALAGCREPYVDDGAASVATDDVQIRRIWIRTPKPVGSFVRRFDKGRYPDLVLADP